MQIERVCSRFKRDGLPDAIAGFDHVNRYYDPKQGVYVAKILPGEFYVSRHGEMIVTVLGSCVAACIRDKVIGIGGMNHFMLPQNKNPMEKDRIDSESARYGNWAMEYLINTILKYGGQKRNLEIKLFGGGKVLSNMEVIDVGQNNIDFVLAYLKHEGYPLAAGDLGSDCPRKVHYFPDTGAVKVKRLRKVENETVLERETKYARDLVVKNSGGSIEIF